MSFDYILEYALVGMALCLLFSIKVELSVIRKGVHKAIHIAEVHMLIDQGLIKPEDVMEVEIRHREEA